MQRVAKMMGRGISTDSILAKTALPLAVWTMRAKTASENERGKRKLNGEDDGVGDGVGDEESGGRGEGCLALGVALPAEREAAKEGEGTGDPFEESCRVGDKKSEDIESGSSAASYRSWRMDVTFSMLTRAASVDGATAGAGEEEVSEEADSDLE